MRKLKNSKFIYALNQEFGKELADTYGDDIITKKEINMPSKIKTNNNNFVMVNQMENNIRDNLLKKIGFTYFGYLLVLLDTLDYSNRIEFNNLLSFGVSTPMIKIVRKKLKESGIVKKLGNDFYINPEIVRKGQDIPLYVLDLFK